MRLVLVQTDKAIVLVMLVDHVSGLVGFDAIVSFSLDRRKMTNVTNCLMLL